MTRIAGHHRHVRRQSQCLAQGFLAVLGRVVEEVDGHDEGHLCAALCVSGGPPSRHSWITGAPVPPRITANGRGVPELHVGTALQQTFVQMKCHPAGNGVRRYPRHAVEDSLPDLGSATT
jgi:hypothetical protein